MIGGIIIQGKRYSVLDFVSCVCMSIGLAFFVLAGSTLQPTFSSVGIAMMSGALCADAGIGNVQEKAFKRFQASNTEMVLYSYGIGVIYLFILLLGQGTLLEGFVYFAQDPLQ